jgi:hypothetical protein
MIGRAAPPVVLVTLLLVALAAPPAARPQSGAPAAGAAPKAASSVPKESCTTCHVEIGDERLTNPVKAYAQDIHAAKGIGCTGCHGGDGTDDGIGAMDPAKGYIGVPARAGLAQVCGRCHSDARLMKQYNPALRVDQVAEYASSGHGRRLRESGDPKVAVCSSCHPAHAIKPPADPTSSVHPLRVAETCARCHADAAHMAGRSLPTDQFARFTASVHWKAMTAKGDLSAPTCNDCHGNHGASPPGVSWVGNVCGQCHAAMAELFAASRHATAFSSLGVPGCATCHDNHAIQPASVEMVGLGAGAACTGCHTAADRGGQAATAMRTALDRLRAEHARVAARLDKAEHAGMEVSQVRFDLNGAGDALVKARAAVHAASVEAVTAHTDAGLAITAKADARALRALDELRFRRQGLSASLVVIIVLIGALVATIRQRTRRDAMESPPAEGRHDDDH